MPPDYWDYHLATGCPISRSKEVLSEMTPALRERVFRAIKLQGGQASWLIRSNRTR